MRDKIIKILREEYDIDSIEQSNDYEYQYLSGVKYQLSSSNELSVPTWAVTHTEGNSFFQDHIDRYKEYIRNGGIIESFPVHEVHLSEDDTLESMVEYIEEKMYSDDDGGLYEMFKDTIVSEVGWYSFFAGEKKLQKYATEKYGVDPELILIGEKYDEWLEIDGSVRSYKELLDGQVDFLGYKGIKELLAEFKPVFDYFEENKEYNLRDHNHRFAAVKELGAEFVMVELV